MEVFPVSPASRSLPFSRKLAALERAVFDCYNPNEGLDDLAVVVERRSEATIPHEQFVPSSSAMASFDHHRRG